MSPLEDGPHVGLSPVFRKAFRYIAKALLGTFHSDQRTAAHLLSRHPVSVCACATSKARRPTAGTSGRPPLGRAEVLLTIDNSDGALPIEYAEVTIGRTMFRSGGSEYAINGTPCRLLDVQELLSDSGIGREMHVIVGQGQASDAILHATPDDRRGFIEEAAGVLKHRKRKEKALRKLDATDGNLTRLNDLLSEIRRQLKPLGRQAEVARQAATVQADGRDARARLMADDLVTARTALEQELADETILVERREEVEALQASSRERETALETSLRDDLPALSRAQDTWFTLSGLRERLRGTQSLAAERLRNAASAESEPAESGRDPEALEAEAAQVLEHEHAIGAEVRDPPHSSRGSGDRTASAEEAAADEERRVAGLVRAAADRREGLARLHGQVNALRTRAAAADDEIGRLRDARQEAVARADRAQRDFTALETKVAGLDAGEGGSRRRARGRDRSVRRHLRGASRKPATRFGWPTVSGRHWPPASEALEMRPQPSRRSGRTARRH